MAFGTSTIQGFGGAVSDIYAAKGYKLKAEGAEIEKREYGRAAGMAEKNAVYEKWSTDIKKSQADRSLFKSLGQTQADVAGAGFAASGSAIDILRESAGQGAMARAILSEQGLIQEEAYHQQAESYRNMAAAAQVAIDAAHTAEEGAYWSAGIKGATAIASIF